MTLGPNDLQSSENAIFRRLCRLLTVSLGLTGTPNPTSLYDGYAVFRAAIRRYPTHV
jgi:hypothetical protein